MLRWFALLALAVTTSSPWWCSGEAEDAMPEGATDIERAAMLIEQRAAELAARRKAKRLGKGPAVTEAMAKAARIRARDEAHDRFHLSALQPKIEGEFEFEVLAAVGAPQRAALRNKEKNRG